MSDDLNDPKTNTVVVPLFPLPNVVLYPGVIQPLHIFEPRYRQLTADALAGKRLIALVLLRPGWEADYEDRPAIHAVACLGKITADQRLDDGCYNLLLQGLSRVRILHEQASDRLYRTAEMEKLPNTMIPPPHVARGLCRQMVQMAQPWLAPNGPASQHLQKLAQQDFPAHVLCDLLGFTLPLAVEVKQELLEELNVERRVNLLLQHLEANPPSPPTALPEKFPPDFSSN